MTEHGSKVDPLIINGTTNGERARQQFKDNLPPRKPLIRLVSRDPQDNAKVLKTVANDPTAFFGLLGIVDPDDCLSLLEQKDQFKLWEYFGYSVYERETADVAQKAKESLGEENLRTTVLSLVHLDDQYRSNVSIHELVARALSGVKLASALPFVQLPQVFAEYSNFARAETESFDSQLLTMLRYGSDTFARVFYDQEIDESMIGVSESILSDLAVFATKKRNWLTSSDDDSKRITAGNMGIIRSKIEKERPDIALGSQLDELMRALDYEYHSNQAYKTYSLKKRRSSST